MVVFLYVSVDEFLDEKFCCKFFYILEYDNYEYFFFGDVW